MLQAPLKTNTAGLVSFSARSEFNTESGAITGDALAVGGTWTGAGDTDDFSASGGVATRTTVSDSSTNIASGRVVTASTPTLTDCTARVDFTVSYGVGYRLGVVLRYVDINNFLACYLDTFSLTTLRIVKVIGGVATEIAQRIAAEPAASTTHTIEASAYSNGQVTAAVGLKGSELPYIATAFDATLLSGATLDDGKVGLVDWNTAGIPNTRTFDSFLAWVPPVDAVMFASQSVQLATSGITREDTGGTAFGPVSIVNGDLPRFPNRSSGGTVGVLVKASRGDFQALPDSGIDDISVRVYRTPCWLRAPGS